MIADQSDSVAAFVQARMLFCVRLWVLDMRRGLGAEPEIAAALDRLGAPASAAPLKALMQTLSEGCTRMIDVACVCKRQVGPDERILLDALALAQEIRPAEALATLSAFLTRDAARAALRHAERIGTVLAEAGLFLPAPGGSAGLHTMAEAGCPAHVTLH